MRCAGSLAAQLHEIVKSGLGAGAWVGSDWDHQEKIALWRHTLVVAIDRLQRIPERVNTWFDILSTAIRASAWKSQSAEQRALWNSWQRHSVLRCFRPTRSRRGKPYFAKGRAVSSHHLEAVLLQRSGNRSRQIGWRRAGGFQLVLRKRDARCHDK